MTTIIKPAYNIAFVGPGGVGKFYAAKVQKALKSLGGKDLDGDNVGVYIVGRPGSETTKLIKDSGSISVDSANKASEESFRVEINPDHVVENLKDVPGNLVVVSSLKASGNTMDKFYGSLKSEELRGRVLAALPIQNGVGIREGIVNALREAGTPNAEARVGMALTDVFAANGSTPAHVTQTNKTYKLLVGHPEHEAYSQHGAFSHLDKLFKLLGSKEANIQNFENVGSEIKKKKWIKLFWNTAFNGVCAVNNLSLHEAYGSEEHDSMLRGIREEFQNLVDAKFGKAYITRAETFHELTRARTNTDMKFKTSTRADVDSGKALELSPIWGAVISEAESLNVEIPKIKEIYEKLLELNN